MRLNGPGKYDAECTAAREGTQAEAVMLIVLNGSRGSGFAVQSVNPRLLPFLADVLEATIMQMRADLAAGGTP